MQMRTQISRSVTDTHSTKCLFHQDGQLFLDLVMIIIRVLAEIRMEKEIAPFLRQSSEGEETPYECKPQLSQKKLAE